MGLSKDEQKMLKRLQAKAEEPDPPAVGRTLSASIDLGDEKQVAAAKKYGFLPPDDDDGDDDDDDDDDDADADHPPRRRGYFDKDGDK